MKTCKKFSLNKPTTKKSFFKKETKVLIGKLVSLGLSFRVISRIRDLCPELILIPKSEKDIRATFQEANEEVFEMKKKKIGELLEKGERFGITLDKSTIMTS